MSVVLLVAWKLKTEMKLEMVVKHSVLIEHLSGAEQASSSGS